MDNIKIEVFKNSEYGEFRTLIRAGEPWFVAVDVCRVLGLSNSRVAAETLDEDEKADVRIPYTSSNGTVQNRKVCIINEFGLYSLVLKSRKPEAKAFKRWITHEVIPSIRKHGGYMTDNLLDALDANPDAVPEYLSRLRMENARNQSLQVQLQEALPKAVYYDSFVDPADCTNFRTTAKELGIPEKKFTRYMVDNLYLFRDKKRRLFPRSGKKSSGLFLVRDFYTAYGKLDHYTLLTPAGKQHFLDRADEIRAL